MPRNFFDTTIGKADPSSLFLILPGIRVNVYNRGTTSAATIYQRETGSTTGPSPEAGATGGPNPFTTGTSGMIQFWADIGRYDIALHDTTTPARIPDRTIQWNSVPLDDIPGANITGVPAVYSGGIPGASVSGLPVSSLATAVLDYFVPIGTMLDYAGTIDPPPSGGTTRFMIADGRALPQSTFTTLYNLLGGASTPWNTFDGQAAPAAGSFRLPRTGRRMLVADSSVGDVAAGGSVPSALTARARGQVGGEENHTMLTSEMPSHTHSTNPAGDHNHGGGTASMSANVPGIFGISAGAGAVTNVFSTAGAAANHTHGIAASGEHSHVVNPAGSDTAHNNMPPFVVVGPKLIRVQ